MRHKMAARCPSPCRQATELIFLPIPPHNTMKASILLAAASLALMPMAALAALSSPTAESAQPSEARAPLPAAVLADLDRMFNEHLPAMDAYPFAPMEENAIIHRLLEAYRATGDAALETEEDGITVLHLAVRFRCEALARELLRQDADPRALQRTPETAFKLGCGVSAELDSPLAWSICRPWGAPSRKVDAAESIRLINMLLAAGADLKGAEGGHLLGLCALNRDAASEDIFLHLLMLGADAGQSYTYLKGESLLKLVQKNGWTRAEAALQAQEAPDAAAIAVLALAREMLGTLRGISRALDAVSDRSTADAAVPTCTTLIEKLVAIVAVGKNMKEPTGTSEHATMEAELEAAARQLCERLERLDSEGYHGSAALRQALELLTYRF